MPTLPHLPALDSRPAGGAVDHPVRKGPQTKRSTTASTPWFGAAVLRWNSMIAEAILTWLHFPHSQLFSAKAKPGCRLPGFTLLEILIVVAIIGTLASIAVPAFGRILDRSQTTRAIADMRAFQAEIDVFEMEHGHVPDNLAEIGRDDRVDPWNRPYAYLSFRAAGAGWKGAARKDHSLVPLNSTYDLYSLGKDGESAAPLTSKKSHDDIVRANDGGYLGRASEF